MGCDDFSRANCISICRGLAARSRPAEFGLMVRWWPQYGRADLPCFPSLLRQLLMSPAILSARFDQSHRPDDRDQVFHWPFPVVRRPSMKYRLDGVGSRRKGMAPTGTGEESCGPLQRPVPRSRKRHTASFAARPDRLGRDQRVGQVLRQGRRVSSRGSARPDGTGSREEPHIGTACLNRKSE